MGNASFGSQRDELEPGDYLAQVTGVELGEKADFNDPAKKNPAFVWSITIQMRDGSWIGTIFRSSRTISDLSRMPPPQPHMISGLNRLIRACGFQVPQTVESVAAWQESSLVGRQFIWRVEIDPDTGQKVRKFLPLPPQMPQHQGPAASQAPSPQPGPTVQQVYAQAQPTQLMPAGAPPMMDIDTQQAAPRTQNPYSAPGAPAQVVPPAPQSYTQATVAGHLEPIPGMPDPFAHE